MKKLRKRLLSLTLSFVMVLGLIPAMPMTAVKADEPGDSWTNPILISTMDELIEELSKDTSEEQVKYYRLTQDVSYDTRLEKILTEEWEPNEEDAGKLDYATLSQCVLGKGKKNLELMGHDVHYKNNMNNGNYFQTSSEWNFRQGWKKTDSLTFFYLPEGAKLTVSNTSRNSGQIWYDGRMNDRTGLANGPRYSYTAVRDVFRVEAGAELTLNNTDVKAGRNRKIWMLNSFYISKQRETNLIASLTWVGFAYEQIYGSCVVVNGGKVTINGGLFDGRGGERDGYNVIGGGKEYYTNAFMRDPYYFETKHIIGQFLTNTGRKAAVQIAGEGSEVIINDGEFWGNGGANAIGINTLNGHNVQDYKLEIHAGTFDTSKTDKERLPDHCSEMSGNGIFYTVAEDFNMWGDCRITRDTPRGYIGFRAKDGKGNPVVDLSKSRIFVDDLDPEDEITSTDDADFYYKSDHDTIIIQPKEKDIFFSDRENAFGQKVFAIYATDARVKNVIGSNFEGGNKTLKYDRNQGTLLWYTVESNYDLTDMDNFYLKQMSDVNCTWTLYEVTRNSDNSVKSIETTTMTATPTLTYVKDGKLLYVFRCELDNWQKTARSSYQWKQDSNVQYYMKASATESFTTSKHTFTTQMDPSTLPTSGQPREYDGGMQIEYQVSFQNNLNHPKFAVDYANARYGSDPKITLSDELQTLKSQQSACFLYQWQILKNGVWEDYGNWRISPDEAALILNKHYDLLGETMRLKVLEYDGKIKGVLYSNERVVTKAGSAGDDPITPAINVTEDTNHAGKYVFQIDVDSDAQEYLVVPDDGAISPSRRISFLDWSGATTSKVIDNLDYGAYVVYTRYAATATAEAGKKVAYCSAYAKVIKATEDVQISYVTRANSYTSSRNQPVLSDGDDFATYVDGGVRYFIVESVPYGANDEVNKNTQWSCGSADVIQPMKLQRSGSSFTWVECEWGDETKGNTFAFKGIAAGNVQLHAKTTLLNGTVKDTVINVHVMPNAATPYKMTTTAEGEIVKLMPGQKYEPQLVVFPDTVQPNGNNLRWVRKSSTGTTPGVVVNMSTGVVTVKDDAQIGEIATIRGQYSRGSGFTPITFEYQVEVIASDEISAHAHPGEDHKFTTFQPYDENQHLQICACGETSYAGHAFRDMVIRQATNAETGVLRHVCEDCGYYYEETIPVGVHVHELYWDYDEDEHWQNCEAEECPEESFEANRDMHNFTLGGTTEDGQEIYVCTVCGMVKYRKTLNLKFMHNCEFDNNIAMHYVVPKSDLEGYTNIRLVIDMEKYAEDEETATWKQYEVSDYTDYVIKDVEYYHFTFPGIGASEMGNVLKAKIVCEKDGKTVESQRDKFSVKEYAYDRLDKSKSSTYKAIMVDMLNYGAAAQVHFKKNAANPVNAKLTDEQRGFGSSMEGFSVKSVENVIPLNGTPKAYFDKKNVMFDTNVVLVYRLDFSDFTKDLPENVTEEERMANVKVVYTYDNGKGEKSLTIPASQFEKKSGMYLAYCNVLTPAEMGCTVNATIYDGDQPISDTFQYSIESYVSDRLKASSSETFKDLLRKMVLYGRAVKTHFE